MIYGIPLLRNRVAPRCTIADSILLVKITMNRTVFKRILKIEEKSWNDLLKIFNDNNIDTLVCGGINHDGRKLTADCGISVVDNVACSGKEVIEAISTGKLKTGFGLSISPVYNSEIISEDNANENKVFSQDSDCLACENHLCMEGETCGLSLQIRDKLESKETKLILNSALDVSLENERTLCRLSELIYFALEMNYKKIGIAYCTDLSEPAGIVAHVLRRFFDVLSVCCKIGGEQLSDTILNEKNKTACNPYGQANILNMAKTDFNVAIGLCIGTDCIFNEYSNVPVTTLFVKDKSLANNPIGAVYSDYYLKEVQNT